MDPITPAEASARNLRPLTTPIPECENWIVENILRDMRRGGIDAAPVQSKYGIEVWRTNNGWKEITRP